MINEVLKSFASQYFPAKYHDDLLAEIERTGALSDETLKRVGITKPSSIAHIKDVLANIVPKQNLKDLSADQLKSIVGTGGSGTNENVDESQLDIPGLQTRKDIFGQIGSTKGEIDRAGMVRAVTERLKAFGVTNNVDALANQITDTATRLGRYPTADELRNQFSKDTLWSKDSNKAVESAASGKSVAWDTPFNSGKNNDDVYTRKGYVPPELENFFNDQNARNELSGLVSGQINPTDTSEDVKRIEDSLSKKTLAAGNESKLQDFLGSIPNELTGSRESYIKSLRESQNAGFQDTAEELLNQQNALGRLNSGATGDVLSSTYGGIQGHIEDIQAQLENEDNQFYANAAYQEQLRKMLEGNADYATALTSERARVRGEQENRFQTSETALNNQNTNNLLMQRNNAALLNAQRRAQREASFADSQRQAELIGAGGTAVGETAGTALAKPKATPTFGTQG